jgi:ATP-dependent helicase IRC3
VGPGVPLPSGIAQSDHELFDYQVRAVEAGRDWLRSTEHAGIICLPTGGGKTRTAVDLVLRHVLGPEARVLWLCHRQELMDQAIEAFASRAHLAEKPFSIGRFGRKGKTTRLESFAAILVASIPSLARPDVVEAIWDRHRGFNLVVVDECHHGPAKTWTTILRRLRELNPSLKILGLSATPMRAARGEHRSFWKLFERVI